MMNNRSRAAAATRKLSPDELQGSDLTPTKLVQILNHALNQQRHTIEASSRIVMAAAIEGAQAAPSKLSDWNVWTVIIFVGQIVIAAIIIVAFVLGLFNR